MKYIMAIVFLLVVATVIFVIRPQPGYEAGKTGPVPAATNSVEVIPAEDPEQIQADQRRADMEAEFDQLARARRDLDQKLNKLKVVLWDLKLPRAEGDAITETLKNGYAMLKNPNMLGAYSGVDDISTELARVKYLYAQLQQIEDKYRTKETHQ